MEIRHIPGIDLYFDPDEREASELVGAACEKSIPVIENTWGLEPPPRCRVYVMTSWLRFMFHSTPWPFKFLLALFLPLVFLRLRRVWKFAGGWTQRYRRRPAAGVKTPALLKAADRTIGLSIFIKEDNIEERIERITCHELTHAFSAHLALPMWLNEGIAMIAMDEFAGKETVRRDSLAALDKARRDPAPGQYARLSGMKQEEMRYHYARGYWICRYLRETMPSLIPGLLKKRRKARKLERIIARALGMRRRDFWRAIDGKVLEHFRKQFGEEAIASPADVKLEPAEKDRALAGPRPVAAFIDSTGWLIFPLVFWTVVILRWPPEHVAANTWLAVGSLPIPILLVFILRIVWRDTRFHFAVCKPFAEVDGKTFVLPRALKASVPKSAMVCAWVLLILSIVRIALSLFDALYLFPKLGLWGTFGADWIQEFSDAAVMAIWYSLWALVSSDLGSRKITHAESRLALLVALGINLAVLICLLPGSTT